MGWRLIIYCVLAISLTCSFLFITIENESFSSKQNNSSIFNAKEIEIKSSSKNKEIFYTIESEMINALSNSKNLSIFKPNIEINNKNKISSMGKKSREIVLKRFSNKIINKKMIELLGMKND